MTDLTYHLSNRQRKDLLVRGVRLCVALPPPVDPVDDLVAWARSVLTEDVRGLVTDAVEVDLFVHAIRPEDDGTLTSHLGHLIDPDSEMFLQTVAAVEVTLTPTGYRHTASGVQWPKQVVHRGRLMP